MRKYGIYDSTYFGETDHLILTHTTYYTAYQKSLLKTEFVIVPPICYMCYMACHARLTLD